MNRTIISKKCEGMEKSKYEDARKSDTFVLFVSITLATMPLFIGGTALVWTSPVLPYLQSDDTEINPLEKPITTIETSILAALPTLTSVIVCPIVPKLANYAGSKFFLLIVGIGMLVSYLGKAYCHQIVFLIILRCILITLVSSAAIVAQIYIAEVCEDHNRSKYMCLKSLTYPLGNIYTYALGPYFSYRYFNIICALPLVLFLVLFLFAPESPVHFLTKGNADGCKKSLKTLRRNKSIEELDTDFNKIDKTLKLTSSTNQVTFLSLFKTKVNRVALKLTIFLAILEYVSGVTAISAFLGPLLREAGTKYSEDTMTIVVGSIQVLTMFVTSLVVEKIGRRVLLMSSSTGCSISLFLFGLFYYFKANNASFVSQIEWLPLLCISIYYFIHSIGLAPLPIAIITDIFPADIASVALSFAMVVMSCTIFVLNFMYPILVDYAGVHWCIWIYSFSCLVSTVIIYVFLPETKGKSIMEIQEIFKAY